MKRKILSIICCVLVCAAMMLFAGCGRHSGGSGSSSGSVSGSGE